MTLSGRIWLMAGMLGAALVVQGGLLLHMFFGPKNSYPQLSQSFTDMPKTLVVERPDQAAIVWWFETLPAEAEIRQKLPFEPTDLVFRNAKCRERQVDAQCYIVHAENGENRKHHPEVCVRDVLGIPEDQSGRDVVFLGGDKARPVQRFLFNNSPSFGTTIYYWHYTFPPRKQENQTWLQMLNETFSRNPPSVTVQVTTTARRESWPMIEESLLAALDNELRSKHLPANVSMGCDRLPIGIEVK